MTICKSWERQVLENTEAIKALQAGGGADISELEGQVSELNQQMARTLKVPLDFSADTRLVAVNNVNDQEMLSIGSGLAIENGSLVATGGGSGGGSGWTKDSVYLSDLSETFTLNVTDAEAPIIIGIEASEGYYSATLTNNAQASYPNAYSTLFYAWGTTCCIRSEDGTCKIIDAATGQTPPNDGWATIEYWYQ